MTQIGTKLRELRTTRGMTQKELSELLNVSAQAVSRWENDEVEPSLETLSRLAQIFSVSVDELFGRPPVAPPAPEPEIRYVAQESRPVLGICETCNTPIYAKEDIVRENRENGVHVYCKKCKAKADYREKTNEGAEYDTAIKKGWIFASLGAVLGLLIGILALSGGFSGGKLAATILLPICIFAFIFDCFADNNFIGDMWCAVAGWGFKTMPGIIFTLDFDGIVFLITAKILFAVLGFLLATCSVLLATFLGLALGVFALPYAIIQALRKQRMYARTLECMQKGLAK